MWFLVFVPHRVPCFSFVGGVFSALETRGSSPKDDARRCLRHARANAPRNGAGDPESVPAAARSQEPSRRPRDADGSRRGNRLWRLYGQYVLVVCVSLLFFTHLRFNLYHLLLCWQRLVLVLVLCPLRVFSLSLSLQFAHKALAISFLICFRVFHLSMLRPRLRALAS